MIEKLNPLAFERNLEAAQFSAFRRRNRSFGSGNMVVQNNHLRRFRSRGSLVGNGVASLAKDRGCKNAHAGNRKNAYKYESQFVAAFQSPSRAKLIIVALLAILPCSLLLSRPPGFERAPHCQRRFARLFAFSATDWPWSSPRRLALDCVGSEARAGQSHGENGHRRIGSRRLEVNNFRRSQLPIPGW